MRVKETKSFEENIAQVEKELNKKFGQGTLMLLGAPGNIKKVPVIPTGILPLDLALRTGGFPKGRLIEVFGSEGGGKTSIALHLIAKCQEDGGTVAFIDAEHALDPNLAKKYGVDLTKLYFSQPDSATECLAVIERLIGIGIDLIVVDSVAAIAEDNLMEGSLDEASARVATLSRIIGPAIKKFSIMAANSDTCVVFINQLRSNISTGYGSGPSETTPGGRALKFHASLRLDVRREKAVYGKDNVQIGHIIKARVVKNKLAAPYTTAKFKLIYGKRITEEGCLAEMAAEYGILERKGPWYWFNGERIANGLAATQEVMKSRPELAEAIKKRLYEVEEPEPDVTIDETESLIGFEGTEPSDDDTKPLEEDIPIEGEESEETF